MNTRGVCHHHVTHVNAMQATREGGRAIQRWRKAFLQFVAERSPHMPDGREEFGMRDYVRRTGGVVLENLLQQTVQDDAQIARIVAVCAGRAHTLTCFVSRVYM